MVWVNGAVPVRQSGRKIWAMRLSVGQCPVSVRLLGRPGCWLVPALLWFVAVPATAQDIESKDVNPATARERLEKNKALLEANRARAGKVKTEVATLAEERRELDKKLISSGELIKQTEAKMTAIEGRLGGLEVREQKLRTSLGRQHRSIAGLLAAIQRMGRNPPPVMITRRQDALAMVRSAMLLARAFPHLKDSATRLAGQLGELVAVIDGIRKERDDLSAESRRLIAAQASLEILMQTKRDSLRLRQNELAEVERTVRQIGENVGNLEQLIAELGPATARIVPPLPSEKPAVQQPGETKVAMHIPRPDATPPANGGSPSVKVPYNLEPEGNIFVAGRPIGPAIPFHQAKGQLPLPAAGIIDQEFNSPTQYGGRSKGIVIKTRYGGQITSPCDGSVLFAGKFRSYGQLLIIDAGDGYHVLLAGLSRIDVQPGQFVLKAEPVGTMRQSPGKRAGPDSPRLYVEIRKDGLPINPRPWWSASSIGKVQG
jgi:septal ring factor EnvC (AmiA/AmiB activator)